MKIQQKLFNPDQLTLPTGSASAMNLSNLIDVTTVVPSIGLFDPARAPSTIPGERCGGFTHQAGKAEMHDAKIPPV